MLTLLFNQSSAAVVIGAGGIASAEAFGLPTVFAHWPIVDDDDIASQEAFGQPAITIRSIIADAGGIASAEAFGQPTVSTAGGEAPAQSGGRRRRAPWWLHEPRPWTEARPPYQFVVQVVDAGGIPSAEAFGLPTITTQRSVKRRRREEELLAA